MENIKILVVEDQAFISHYITMQLEKLGYTIVGELITGEEVLLFLKENTPDLIIMDINLSGNLTGIETAKIINQEYKIPFLYLTNIRQDDTFKKALSTHPAAYLNKPFEALELSRNIELALYTASIYELTGKRETKQISLHHDSAIPEEETATFFLNKFLFIKDDYRYYKVNMDEILWIKADSSYSTVKTIEKEFVISKNLKTVSLKLAKYFIQIHKSYIINIEKIQGLEKTHVIIANQDIPIGKTYYKKFKEMLTMV